MWGAAFAALLIVVLPVSAQESPFSLSSGADEPDSRGSGAAPTGA